MSPRVATDADLLRREVHPVLVASDRLKPGALLEPDDEEQRHLKARRAEPGDALRLYDGAGTIGDGRLEERARRLMIAVGSVRSVPAPTRLSLAVGAGDRERFGWLAEKAAELGVTELIPLETERALSVATRLRSSHLASLQRRALVSIKQSGAAWAPVIRPPAGIETLLEPGAPGTARWLADATGSGPPSLAPDAPATVVVGPEGGLTDAERETLVARGFTPVRLARDVLRFETAAVAAAVIIGSYRVPRE